MISENRDILVERLEQQVVAKEQEIEEMRSSLKESIVSELRDGMKDDLDFDKRITTLEQKVRDIGLSYEGVMKELLDQKTVIQDLKDKYLKPEAKEQVPVEPVNDVPKTLSDWHDRTPVREETPAREEIPEPAAKSSYIIAESDETKTPDPPEKKIENNIIIAKQDNPKSAGKGEVVVEAREDEDVVIEYKK